MNNILTNQTIIAINNDKIYLESIMRLQQFNNIL